MASAGIRERELGALLSRIRVWLFCYYVRSAPCHGRYWGSLLNPTIVFLADGAPERKSYPTYDVVLVKNSIPSSGL